MTLWVTPARRASSACVRPAAFRAARNTEPASFTRTSIADRHYPAVTDQDASLGRAMRRGLGPTLKWPVLGVRPARQFLEDLGHLVEGQATVNGA
jgi:hypothetical protein